MTSPVRQQHNHPKRTAIVAALIIIATTLLVIVFAVQPAAAAGPNVAATPTATLRTTPTVTPAATLRAAATRRAAVRPTPTRTPTRTPTPAATVPATAATGLEVYKRLGCAGCHKLAAAGSTGGYGPTHEHMAAIAAERLASDYDGAATTVAEYLRESIIDPEAYVVANYRMLRYRMPRYPSIQPSEVEALVALLLEQR